MKRLVSRVDTTGSRASLAFPKAYDDYRQRFQIAVRRGRLVSSMNSTSQKTGFSIGVEFQPKPAGVCLSPLRSLLEDLIYRLP